MKCRYMLSCARTMALLALTLPYAGMATLCTVEEYVAPPVTGHVHASTLVALKDGGYLAAWFEGSKEGAGDVAIYGAERRRGAWGAKRCLAKVNPVSPHWNPVLRRAEDGRLELFFKVGRNCADWRTYVQESRDEGVTWCPPRELVPGDVWGGRGPVKNKCLRLRNGRWLAPASREFDPSKPWSLQFQWRAFVDISDDDGRSWRKSGEFPMPPVTVDVKNPPGVIQPTLWEDEGGVHAFMRATDGWVWRTDSTDNGETWGECHHAPLENINSGLDCVRASDGRLYLALNGKSATAGGWGRRNHLEIKVSADGGRTWSLFATLADDAPKQSDGRATEYSYPAMIEPRPGVLAVTFTCNRRQIAFREFTLPSAAKADTERKAALPSPVVPLKDGEEPLHLWLDDPPDWNKDPYQYPEVAGAARGRVFQATAATGGYNHHAQIIFWNGKFHAAWTNHRYGEDGPGQRVMHAVSNDGLGWSDPDEVFPSLVPEAPVGGTGFYSQTRTFVEWEGRLFAQARFYQTVGWNSMDKKKTSPVFTRECRFPVCRSLGMLHREIRADGSLGAIFSGQCDLLPTNALVDVKAMKEYLPAFRWPIMPYRVDDACRQNRGFHRFTEQVVWQNKDGWALLFRDDSETYRKWASYSRDGRKWSAPRPTDILDAPAFSCVLTLADGTVLLFGNHHGRGYRDPACGFHTRDPLLVSVCRDGVHFGGTHTVRVGQQSFRVPGVRFRTGGAQYPTAIAQDGFCYVIYSMGKEDIEVTRFPIAPLLNAFSCRKPSNEDTK